MPQGKFKGQPMENVPYWHLLWLAGNRFAIPPFNVISTKTGMF